MFVNCAIVESILLKVRICQCFTINDEIIIHLFAIYLSDSCLTILDRYTCFF